MMCLSMRLLVKKKHYPSPMEITFISENETTQKNVSPPLGTKGEQYTIVNFIMKKICKILLSIFLFTVVITTEKHTFIEMQGRQDSPFITHGINQNPVLKHGVPLRGAFFSKCYL